MSRQKNLKRNLLICLLAGSAVMYTLPLHAATSVVANNALPTLPMVNGQIKDGYGFVTGGSNTNIVTDGLQMNITQNDPNAVIKWGSFDVGGSATVNFKGPESGYNTLNYVNAGGSMSQIYGTINANNNGNIFIVNPAGVQIGNSAQINVGSLYVSNKYLNESELKGFAGTITPKMIDATQTADAELMSLGNINAANNVTFDGNRIVLDTDRVIITNHQNGKLNIKTTDTNNVVLGYEAYDENNGYTDTVDNEKSFNVTKVTIENGTIKEENANVKGYMWVEDVEQLQAINTNLGGNYALRNSIDATSTAQGTGFNPIGLDGNGKVVVHDGNKYGFTGNFDGIDYNIFGLTIDRSGEANVGLFGVAHDANINNVTLVGGSITGGSVVGSVVGAALGNTHITNATNSASVTGNTDVGGIVGYSGNEIDNVGDSGATEKVETDSHFTNLVNTGTVHSNGENNVSVSNAGGLIGYMYNGTLDGNSYNLGDVSGTEANVGGLVGHAVNSTIGDGTNLVYNRMDVTGAYNVGGIVGNMEGTTVQNAENSGNVTATGFMTGKYYYHTANGGTHIAKVDVNVANVGGIAGKADDTVKADGTVDKKSEIKNVTNSGNVSSSKQAGNDYYDAGNVGGIVGSAVDTDITNATNKENEVRGAHNVGGVAGYFGNSNVNNNIKYTINRGINDGGDIMATGARFNNNFVKEIIRPASDRQTEEFIIGNIGGVVGYMDGDNVYVTGSANRGTVHTSEPNDPKNVQDYEKAANVGGIVGKIDRSDTLELSDLNGEKGKITNAAVSNSYNTGDVLGYTGVGGVVGMMYNGEVAGSYNLGHITTTRQSSVGVNSIDSLNMGGIVGDTTENSDAEALLYDVYNKGQIGDEEFEYFGRHVGGIVGRLSGDIEKAYNTGAIYNGYSVVGGIAGWVFKGNINNSFNTGNITVYNQNSHSSQVGGIAGAAQGGNGIFINNVYNLGTLRSFDVGYGNNSVGGILGTATQAGTVTINNAYTTGNLYSGKLDKQTNTFKEDLKIVETYKDGNLTGVNTKINSIYGSYEYNASVVVGDYTYYIQPDNDENGNPLFTKLTGRHDLARHSVEFSNKSDYEYEFDGGITEPTGGDVDEDSAWRIYGGNTPILNAFLPNSEDYFSNSENMAGIGSIQYGTAYDPLLTIINAAKGTNELKYNWEDLGINNAAGIAVYGAGLTLDSFMATGATGYFGGTIYADGALNINGVNNDIGIGSAADIYGSAVNITTDGKVTIYGDVTATGNTTNDVDNSEMKVEDAGNITINAGDVDVYGTLTSATTADYGNDVKIPGIEGTAVTWNPGNVSDPYAEMSDIADRFAHTTGKSNVNGNITINAGKDEDGNAIGGGNVNIYFGNQEQGLITTGGDLQVEATGNIFVDSDLDVGGNLKLTSTGKNSEILLTLTNIGKVQADKFTGVIENFLNGKNIVDINKNDLLNVIQEAYPGVEFKNEYVDRIVAALTKYEKSGNKASAIEQLNNDIAVAYMHQFMHNFDKTVEGSNKIYFNADSGNAKLTVDMWDYGNNEYDFAKYDTKFDEQGTKHTFKDELDNLDLHVNNDTAGVHANASEYVYVEVSNGAQLKAIQQAGADALAYNYALMGDINASGVSGYEAIGAGSDTGFTGTFDGRGNRIIGLDTTKDSNGTNNNSMAKAGIFSTIGESGTVKNVNIYSGNFEGKNTAGAVAGENNGRIENIITFGNTVTSDGKAGGIVGVNKGDKGNIITNEDGTITLEPAENEQFATGIIDVESIGSVIAEGSNAVAGGLVGTNEGALGNSYSDSAVTSTAGTSAGLGGVVGVNTEDGDVQYVDSLGVTNGGSTGSSNVGGIIGVNNGNMYSGYNESIVSGKDNVGGIIGVNTNTVSNIVNATGVVGTNNIGGLVGDNSNSVTNGRNNGTITGVEKVGGLVGYNGKDAVLTDLVNAEAADITGQKYVGGIAGNNAGTITTGNADDEDEKANLINRGSITGHTYVGGVAGTNSGTIINANNDVELNADKDGAQYFGGIAGENTGTIENATNTANVNAAGANYVGGIVGLNKGTLNGSSNKGSVTGLNFVGGVAGKNVAAIKGTLTNGELTTIKNGGIVTAESGGAGGIFGVNEGVIDSIHLVSEGIVKGTNPETGESGTGGIFGINEGTITNSVLENTNGTVSGVSNTGGLIGINSGNISQTTLKNVADIEVSGNVQNIGGLIGKNTGTITGGRLEADGKTDAGYYKYQIYNNGTITVTGEGQNIGGLIGYNTIANGTPGSLTAGYNTGAIKAENSSNVGGIVGNNAGTVDQVFNTVMTGVDDKGNTVYGTITGKDNVGGLVGTNSGTLSNAYNTTEVKSTNNGVVGNAVGVNTNKVENIYGYSELVGNGNEATKSYVINNSDEWKQQEKYIGFDFTTSDNTPAIWKNYDGYSNPLLKVFLTKAQYNGDTEFTYNATEQGLTISSNTIINAADKLDAYNNANSLLTATQNKNAGKDYLGIYSQQIAASGKGDAFDPNNLGYDIDVTYDIEKAQLNITLNDVHRTYGNTTITSGGYTIDSISGWKGEDAILADGVTISASNNKNSFAETDTALTGNNSEKVTENAGGKYTWSADVTLSEEIAQNYEIKTTTLTGNSYVKKAGLEITVNGAETTYGTAFDESKYGYTVGTLANGDAADTVKAEIGNVTYTNSAAKDGTNGVWTDNAGTHKEAIGIDGNIDLGNYDVTISKGDAEINKAELVITVGNAETVYGDAFTNADYSHTLSGITNGDKADNIDTLLGGNYVNGVSVETGKATANAGTYEDKLDFANYNELNNYNIKVEQGDVVVTKADLKIEADNITSAVGNVPNYTGTDIQQGLVNGDTISDTIYNYGVSAGTDVNVEGNYTVGIYVDGSYYELSNPDWSTVTGLDFLKNYNVTFTTGTLTVTEQVMPDLPDNWPNNRWDYLFGDNPFDRNENFRERKAEVNFVDGAMEI